jgi:predicted  nucleic acid-binding Zn-ribbon protein
LSERIAQHKAVLQEAGAKQARAQARLTQARGRLAQVEPERQRWAQEVADLEALYRARNRPERPHSRLAQARRKLAVRERRLGRRQKDLERAQRWLERCRKKVADLEAELQELEQRSRTTVPTPGPSAPSSAWTEGSPAATTLPCSSRWVTRSMALPRTARW